MHAHSAPQIPEDFQFLQFDAQRVGAEVPEVVRVSVSGPEGRNLSALRYGDAPAELVCLHGAGLNAHSFDPMVFAAAVPAVALDLPGHGHSQWRDDAVYTPETMVDDVAAGIRAWSAPPVTVLGHSLGGLTAMLLAERYPELVSSLIIVDITPEATQSESAATVLEFISGKRSFASREEMVDRAVDFGIGGDREALLRGVTLNSVQREDGRYQWIHHLAHLAHLTAPEGSDDQAARSYWPEIDTPMTFVRASDGMVTAADTEKWCEKYPQTKVLELNGPHNLHEARPKELAAVVTAHLHGVQ